MKIKDYLAKTIIWDKTKDAQHPWCSTLEGKKVSVRLNDFPAENLYTLIVGTSEIDFDDWPSAWKRPSTKTARKTAQTNGSRRGRPVKAL